MGQVPARILIIGNGRLATTLWDVVHAPDFPSPIVVSRWARKDETDLTSVLSKFNPTHVWLALSDRAIREFTIVHREQLVGRTVVHFAGSLGGWPGVHAAHPLTTLNGKGDHTFAWFSEIPFVLDFDGPGLTSLLPGFKNPTYRLDPRKRAYYHALCATAGGFSILLWETIAKRFEKDLGLPASALTIFRRQIFKNLDEAGDVSVLTGPLSRGDSETLETHRSALLDHFEMPLLKIYDAFADLFRTEREKSENRT